MAYGISAGGGRARHALAQRVGRRFVAPLLIGHRAARGGNQHDGGKKSGDRLHGKSPLLSLTENLGRTLSARGDRDGLEIRRCRRLKRRTKTKTSFGFDE